MQRIVVSLSEEGSEQINICRGTCDEGNTELSNGIDLGDLPYGIYTLRVNAYTYNDRNSESNKWIETHSGLIEDLVLGSGLENMELFVEMKVGGTESLIQGASAIEIDEEAINVGTDINTISGDIAPISSYCLDLNDDGDFYVSWIEKTDDLFYLKIIGYDSAANLIVPETLLNGPSDTDMMVLKTCKFVGEKFYVLYGESNDGGEWYLNMIMFEEPGSFETVNITDISDQTAIILNDFNFDAKEGYVAVVYKDSWNYIKLYDNDLNLLKGPIPFSSSASTNPNVKILNQQNLITTNTFSYYVNGFVYRIETLLDFELRDTINRSISALMEDLLLSFSTYSDYFTQNYSFEYLEETDRVVLAHDRGDIWEREDDDIIVYDIDLSGGSNFYAEGEYLISGDRGRLQPALSRYRGNNLAFVWAEQIDLSSNYAVRYSLFLELSSLNDENKHTVYEDPISAGNTYYLSPRLKINSDGFGIIGAVRQHVTDPYRIVLKRYLF